MRRYRRLVVMVKEPRPGRVKTRLGREIGHTAAAWWFRHQVARLIRELRDPRWEVVLAVSPDHAGVTSRIWAEDLRRVPQGRGDLGDRMRQQFQAAPPGPVVIIGADIPGITRNHIAGAFEALGRAPSVLGPAPDGGYWLVGLKRTSPPPNTVFEGVRWSSPHAREDTLRTLPGPVAMLATLRDVDTKADLDHLRRLRIS